MLEPRFHVLLKDPVSGLPAFVSTSSSASPTVAPDGDVYYGVLENPFPSHDDRGWLLHYNATLSRAKTPGSFGWDNTVSVMPARGVPGYHGASPYLLVSKYNNYLGIGPDGDGRNRVALLDPGASRKDPYATTRVMKAVHTILSPVHEPGGPAGARYEWCINSAVVDPAGHSVIVNSEDGPSTAGIWPGTPWPRRSTSTARSPRRTPRPSSGPTAPFTPSITPPSTQSDARTAAVDGLASPRRGPRIGPRYEPSLVKKNVASAPADPATTMTPQSSSTRSTARPAGVTGFASDEETVSTCAEVKKSAWPNVVTWVPRADPSSPYIATAPARSTTMVATKSSVSRLASRRWRSSIVQSRATSSRIAPTRPV
jgi:hypothetical protein